MNSSKIPLILRSTIETKIPIVGVEICGLVAILLVHLILLINTRFTLWPEMVVYPFLLNNGFFLYKDIINPYPPFFPSFLAFYAKFFGYNPLPYQILTWIVILVIDLVIFSISYRISKKTTSAIFSTLFFLVISVSFSINGLWFDLVQIPLLLVSFYYFYKLLNARKDISSHWWILSFLLSLSFFIKQQTIWLIILFLILSLFKVRKKLNEIYAKTLIFILPLLILFFIQMIFFWQKGNFEDFIFWTFYFPFFKASQMPGYLDLPSLKQLAIILLLFLIFLPILQKRKLATSLILVTSFVSLLFTLPRFDYFHLTPTLAILSLAFGQNLKTFASSMIWVKTVSFVSVVLLLVFFSRYLINNWTHQIRFFEEEIFQVAKFLEITTSPDESLYIQNGPDQLLPLSKRLPTKPWADEFPWYLEVAGLQDKVLKGLSEKKPRFIIYKPYENGQKYEIGSYKPSKIAFYIDSKYKEILRISDTLWLKTMK